MTQQDIKPDYLNIARRLQSVARNNTGVAILEVRLVIDEAGKIFWTAPKLTLLEPRGAAEEILRLLTEKS